MSGAALFSVQRAAVIAGCTAFVLGSSCSGSGDQDRRAEANPAEAKPTLTTVPDGTEPPGADHAQAGTECKQIADALTPFTQENIERAAARWSPNGDTQGLAQRLSRCDDANGLSAEAAAYVLPQGADQVRIEYQYGPESLYVKGPTGAAAFLEGSNTLLASVKLIGMGGGGRSEPLTIRFAETQFSASGLEVYKGVLKFHWDTGERFRSDRMLGHQLADVFKEWPR